MPLVHAPEKRPSLAKNIDILSTHLKLIWSQAVILLATVRVIKRKKTTVIKPEVKLQYNNKILHISRLNPDNLGQSSSFVT